MIVDSHIHMYPPEVFSDPLAWGARHREPWWTFCVAPPHQPTLQGWATVDTLLRDMDTAGVDHAVMLGWYWEHQETAELQNSWFIDWVKQHPDRLSGFASVVAGSGQRGLDATRRALDSGLRGLGELLPQAQGFSFKDESWAALMALAKEYGVATNLHVTDPLAITPGSCVKATPLEPYIDLVKDFPDNLFIFAHWGGGIPFYELNRRLRPLLKNVYYDTAASPLLYDPKVYAQVCDLIGPERILFGTDYPLLTHPRLTQTPEFVRDLEEARSSGLSKTQLELVLGENARRLFKL
ncbi:MAG TPA: amidohydrolase family protein [Opitutaceae bacterium]|nr:amidohydrolase family protein [Opitutaceae bacterium]